MIGQIYFSCSVCFGDPNSLASKSLSISVFFLFGVICAVLTGIAWTAFNWSVRAKKINSGVSD